MHELSLVAALFAEVDRALEPHPDASVGALHVRVGELAGVNVELFQSAYEVCRAASRFADAALALTFEAAVWTCPRCQLDIARGQSLTCSRCGSSARLVRGGDVFLDRIEAEVAHV